MSRPKVYKNKNEYIDQWQKEHYGKITIKLQKEEAIKIRAYSAVIGPNNSRFILNACEEYFQRFYDERSDEEKSAIDKSIADFTEEYIRNQKEKEQMKKERSPK